MNSRKRKARIANLIGKIFIMLLFLVMIINVAVPDREESEMENRTLESRPNFNMATILTGDFMEQWENYLSDQFVGRDIWRSVKVSIDRLGGSRMENGIYIGRNGQLMEDIEVPGEGQMDENVSAIRNFADTYDDVSVTMMLVPDAACILSDSLPAFAEVEDQRQLFSMAERGLGESVNWIKTDHHWTTQAAFYVFQDAAPTLGIEGDVSDDFVSYAVTDSFNGVLASTSGVGLDEQEQIDIYAPTEGDDDLVVSYVDEGRKTTSLYDSSKLEERDKYGVFLGGNTSVIDIRTVSTSPSRCQGFFCKLFYSFPGAVLP